MTESNPEADALIEGYKQVLVAEAELARGDLDEIEDHLRVLADELRDQGMPRVAAVREACRRLGDPRAVAREHARVRSPFGARLSKLRAYSAVALMVPPIVMSAKMLIPHSGMVSIYGLQLVFATVLALALALRLTWARPIVLGGIASFAIQVAHSLVAVPNQNPIWLVLYLGILAFVMPWRRSEITSSGVALVLQVWAFAAAAYALQFVVSTPTGYHAMSSGAHVAFYTTAIATIGTVLRARWGAIASLASAAMLAFSFWELEPLNFMFPFQSRLVFLGLVLSGSLAAFIATFIGWRTSRSTLGTLAQVLA